MASHFDIALSLLDSAHSEDPSTITDSITGREIPYELHYAQKMTSYLNSHSPDASEPLRLAIRAQHLRRWEVPRSSYPATKAGYLSWRAFLKKRQAEMAEELCLQAGCNAVDAAKVAALVRKEGLGKGGDGGEPDVQVLEDVACLVFLDDQFEQFEKGLGDEDKMVNILRKTWRKMGKRGREMALNMKMDGRPRELVVKALEEEERDTNGVPS